MVGILTEELNACTAAAENLDEMPVSHADARFDLMKLRDDCYELGTNAQAVLSLQKSSGGGEFSMVILNESSAATLGLDFPQQPLSVLHYLGTLIGNMGEKSGSLATEFFAQLTGESERQLPARQHSFSELNKQKVNAGTQRRSQGTQSLNGKQVRLNYI